MDTKHRPNKGFQIQGFFTALFYGCRWRSRQCLCIFAKLFNALASFRIDARLAVIGFGRFLKSLAKKNEKHGVKRAEEFSRTQELNVMEQELIRSWVWSTSSSVPFILLNVFGWAFYFVPSLIAWSRKHRSLPAIIALNILLGWTGIGWIGAFVWSLSWPGYDNPYPPASKGNGTSEPDQYE